MTFSAACYFFGTTHFRFQRCIFVLSALAFVLRFTTDSYCNAARKCTWLWSRENAHSYWATANEVKYLYGILVVSYMRRGRDFFWIWSVVHIYNYEFCHFSTKSTTFTFAMIEKFCSEISSNLVVFCGKYDFL